jgi:hypothetical protein
MDGVKNPQAVTDAFGMCSIIYADGCRRKDYDLIEYIEKELEDCGDALDAVRDEAREILENEGTELTNKKSTCFGCNVM